VAVILIQAQEQGRPPEKTSRFYAKGALQYLVPILTQTLAKQVSCSVLHITCAYLWCKHQCFDV